MRKLFKMRCPGCGFPYQYEGKEKVWERCPACNYLGNFSDFVIEEDIEPPPFYNSEEEYEDGKD